jgi:8-oxo-dGTP diphosphatase
VKNYVVGFLFSGSKVLLIRKQRPDWQKGMLNGIGGHIEDGESPLDAMRREFQEEAGIRVNDWRHAALMMGPTFMLWVYAAEVSQQTFSETKDMTDEKLTTCDRFSLPKDILPNLQWLVPLCCDPDIKTPITIEYTDKD